MWVAGGRKDNKTTEGFLILFMHWIFFLLLKVCISHSRVWAIPVDFIGNWKHLVPRGTRPRSLVCNECKCFQSWGRKTNLNTIPLKMLCLLCKSVVWLFDLSPAEIGGRVLNQARRFRGNLERHGLEAPLKDAISTSVGLHFSSKQTLPGDPSWVLSLRKWKAVKEGNPVYSNL